MKSLNLILLAAIALTLIGCTTSAGGSDANTAQSITGLTVYPTPASVFLSGSLGVYPYGGTAPYNFVIVSGGGSINPSQGSQTTFTAPATAGQTVIQVTDATGLIVNYDISISSTSSTTTTTTTTTSSGDASCEGSYSVTVAGTSANLYLVQDSSGYLGGYLLMSGYYYPMSGTCSMSGTTGSISLQNWDFGTTYAATITTSGSTASISAGTVTFSDSTTSTWSGSRSSEFTMNSVTASCEGTYNAVINGNSATLYLFGDSGGNVIGALSMQGYYYVMAGSCLINGTTGTASFVNKTTGSTYTGNITVGSSISMSGTFQLSAGGSDNWSASQ